MSYRSPSHERLHRRPPTLVFARRAATRSATIGCTRRRGHGEIAAVSDEDHSPRV